MRNPISEYLEKVHRGVPAKEMREYYQREDKVKEYTELINEEILTEGIFGTISSIFNAIGEFFSGGRPKDAQIKLIFKTFRKTQEKCFKYHPKTKIRKASGDQWGIQTSSEEYVSDNPKLAVCLARAEMNFLKDIISYIKKNKTTVCKNNVLKGRCENWIEKQLPRLESELNALEQAVIKAKLDPAKLKKVLK